MVGGLASGGAWDALGEGRGRGSHARDVSLREGWWFNRGGTKIAGDDDDGESGESGEDGVVGGLVNSGARDTLEGEALVSEWGWACGSRGRQ